MIKIVIFAFPLVFYSPLHAACYEQGDSDLIEKQIRTYAKKGVDKLVDNKITKKLIDCVIAENEEKSNYS